MDLDCVKVLTPVSNLPQTTPYSVTRVTSVTTSVMKENVNKYPIAITRAYNWCIEDK